MFKNTTKERGATLLEILVAVGLLAMISSLVLASFSQFRARKTLDATIESTLSAFSRAHLDTIASLNDKQYGVHLDADKAVYFVGTTYNAGDATNIPYVLNSAIEIADISLTGGGSDVIFEKLTGGTGQSGTFVIRVKADPSKKGVITVNGTGAISLK